MRIDLAPMTPARRLRAILPGLLALLPALASAQDVKPVLDTGDTAWMLASTVLVIMMAVPGLALFYGGQVRSKNVLSTSIQVFVVFSLLTVLWVVYGYSLAFTGEGRFIGEGLTEPSPPRSTAVIPFALDRQVIVEREGVSRPALALEWLILMFT